ncbi:hypothetical protein D4764_13G0002590 [Takifugu flavidus]|uniref:Uncharacterized protein n=1 Tax=Takifugu flavidus TaxID=433684 RepID=A0A5C6PBS1_9TELE|nr:hypothetical protein D4764_13G0002590 [Takifugu flavidus]
MVGEPEKLNEGPARPGRDSALEPGMELNDRPPLAYDLTSDAQCSSYQMKSRPLRVGGVGEGQGLGRIEGANKRIEQLAESRVQPRKHTETRHAEHGPATFVSSPKRMSLSGRLGDSHQAAGKWTSSVLADSHLSPPEVDQQVARP